MRTSKTRTNSTMGNSFLDQFEGQITNFKLAPKKYGCEKDMDLRPKKKLKGLKACKLGSRPGCKGKVNFSDVNGSCALLR